MQIHGTKGVEKGRKFVVWVMCKTIIGKDVFRSKQTLPTLAWRDNSIKTDGAVVVGLMLKMKFSILNGTVTFFIP